MRVFLGGEGRHEIGTRPQPGGRTTPGVVEALLRRVVGDECEIVGACYWKDLRSFSAGASLRGHRDGRNVLRLMERASASGADVLAFVRDLDGERERARVIAHAMADADVAPGLRVIGGCAAPMIEGWVLAMLAVPGTDELSRAKAIRLLESRGHGGATTAEFVAIVEAATFPTPAATLEAWMALARQHLAGS
jgi:hypothetical protein